MYKALIGAGLGALAGVGWSVIGYIAKKTGPEGAEFTFKGFGKAVLTGVLAGGALGFGGVEITSYSQLIGTYIGDVSVVAVSQKGLNIVYNLLDKANKKL